MEIRNPIYNVFGTIDCEINHPDYGWIPFTASPDDRPDIYDAALAMGPAPAHPPPPPPAPTPEELLAQAQANRQSAFQREADPLFFKVQRGEAPEQEWLDKVAEIRARYPYPEDET
jgi:hypothetical protein